MTKRLVNLVSKQIYEIYMTGYTRCYLEVMDRSRKPGDKPLTDIQKKKMVAEIMENGKPEAMKQSARDLISFIQDKKWKTK